MLHKFKAVVLIEVTTCVDGCCVDVSRFNVNVFALDKDHMLEAVKKFDPRASVKIESYEDMGKIEQVDYPGMTVAKDGISIYKGPHDESPFYGANSQISSKA